MCRPGIGLLLRMLRVASRWRRLRADSLDISFIGYQRARVAIVLPLVVALERTVLQVPEVVVEGGLVRQRLDRLAASVTVVDGDRSRASGAGHLQDATHAVPNLNWAGGSSRPRYFQIRGIGERSHYAGEGPPSFSVGFVMDDVDLSGMGTAGLLFDVDQVEVFKGPQSNYFWPQRLGRADQLALGRSPAGVCRSG